MLGKQGVLLCLGSLLFCLPAPMSQRERERETERERERVRGREGEVDYELCVRAYTQTPHARARAHTHTFGSPLARNFPGHHQCAARLPTQPMLRGTDLHQQLISAPLMFTRTSLYFCSE